MKIKLTKEQIEKMLLIILILITIISCEHTPIETKNVGNDMEINLLFEHDGCKIFRFYDMGHKYFAHCKEADSISWQESCGKGCVRNENLQTERNK